MWHTLQKSRGHLRQGQARVVGAAGAGAFALLLLFAESFAAVEKNIPDPDITVAVETNLLIDEGVPSRLIDVQTQNGIVTLSGSVDNILAKEQATKVAETIKGVRAIINNIVVAPPARSDKELYNDVVLALAQDPATDAYEITATVTDGVATLTGTVQSWQEKELAGYVTKGVRGIKAVNNSLTIEYKTDRPDSEIEADVKRRLATTPWVDALLIDVNVQDGKVSLKGSVGSATEKSHAYRNAWVTGVKAVDDSELKVVWWANEEQQQKERVIPLKSDEEVEQAVKDAFLYDPRVLSLNPTVSVENGIVTLTGVVENLKAKHAAEQDAQNTVGVWRVKNYLKVRPSGPASDTEIANQIRQALLRSPYVNRFDIDVSVYNGAVYLTGGVDTTFEKLQAADIASGINGVVEVNNAISVRPVFADKFDWEIKQDIDSELWWSPFVDADEVTVSVEDGVATLTGSVDSWHEMSSAIENAYEGGAVRVRNQLTVNGLPSTTS